MTVFSFSEEQRNCLQELINVAMGLASDKLAQTAFNRVLALKVDIRYQLTAHSFDCNMILLIPGEAVIKLQGILDKILADF